MTAPAQPAPVRPGAPASPVAVRTGAIDPVGVVVVLATIAFLAVFVVYPLYRVLAESVLKGGAVDLTGYGRFLTRPDYQSILGNTLTLGLLTATASTVLGFIFAYTLARATPPGARSLRAIAHLPLVAPPFLIAMSTIVLFGRRGLITHDLLGLDLNIYGLGGLVFVQTLTFFPVTFLIFEGLFENLAIDYEQAALNLGASRLRVFATVVLPLLLPGIASAFLLVFVESLADLANPLVMGGDYTVLAALIYQVITGQFDLHIGASLAAVLLVPSIGLFIAQQRLLAGRSYVTVTGRSRGGEQRGATGVARLLIQTATYLMIGLIVLMFGSVIVGSFTRIWGIDNTLTFANYSYVLVDRGARALRDTLTLSVAATPLAALVGLVIAVIVVRSRLRWRSTLDITAMLGAAVPGTVLGIGYVAAFNGRPFFLTGTAAILILVFVVRSMPTAVRAAVAGLEQIDPSIEEAAISLGDGTAGRFRRVTLPMLRPAVLTAMVTSFTRNVTSLSAIIFLTSANWRMVTAQILAEVDVGRLGNAAAYCVVLMVLVIGAIGLLYLLFAWTRFGRPAGVTTRTIG